MAAHRRSGRFVGLAAIGGPIVVAGIVGAGPARADATSYLSDLHHAGIAGEVAHRVDARDPAHTLGVLRGPVVEHQPASALGEQPRLRAFAGTW